MLTSALRLSVNTFPYKCQKPANGKTRVYFSVNPDSPLVGQELYIIDAKGQVAAHTKITPGASIEIQPAIFGKPDYTIKYGVDCQAKANCSFSR